MQAESQPSTKDTVTWPFALAEISNIPGYEVGIQVIERPPGGAAVPHYHPEGHEWVYCAAGSMMLTRISAMLIGLKISMAPATIASGCTGTRPSGTRVR